MSLGKLIRITLLDLVMVLMIVIGAVTIFALGMAPNAASGFIRMGQAIGLPLEDHTPPERWSYALLGLFSEAPPDDSALEEWLSKLPGVYKVRVQRKSANVKAYPEARFFGPAGMTRPDVPWKQLGYTPTSMIALRSNWIIFPPDVAFVASNDQLRLYVVGSLQVGLLLIGLIRMFQNRKLPPMEPVREEHTILIGIGAGLLLGAFYWVCDQAVLHLWGPVPAQSRCWASIPSQGLSISLSGLPQQMVSAEPHIGVIALMGGVVLLFPLAQVAFFCGGLGSLWYSADYRKSGVIVLGILAAILTIDWPFLLPSMLVCMAICWLYLVTQSLVVPLLSLIILGNVIVGVSFGAIPGINHPTNLLPGKWQLISEAPAPDEPVPEAMPLHFRRGGSMQESLRTVAGGNLHFRTSSYRWLNRDVVRLRYLRDTINPNQQTTRVENDETDYLVDVTTRQLRLTRLRDGKVFQYARARE